MAHEQLPTETPLSPRAKRARAVFVGLALLLCGAPLVWPMLDMTDATIPTGIWALVIVSSIANMWVLAYHAKNPPHPKFEMLPRRRMWLRIHIISGVLEFFVGLVALVIPGQIWPAMTMAILALGFHIPSSYVQNAVVSGSRALMVPGYFYAITAHAVCALMVVLNPDSLFWIVNSFLLFNTYAWVRIYGFLFHRYNLFASGRYTAMVLAAGITTMTAVFGPLLPLSFGLFLWLYIEFHHRLFASAPLAFEAFVRDRERESGVDPKAAVVRLPSPGEAQLERVEQVEPTEQGSMRERAQIVFDMLDLNGDGKLEPVEIELLLSEWGVPSKEVVDYFAAYDLDSDGYIDFDEFYPHMRPVWHFLYEEVVVAAARRGGPRAAVAA